MSRPNSGPMCVTCHAREKEPKRSYCGECRRAYDQRRGYRGMKRKSGSAPRVVARPTQLDYRACMVKLP